MKKTTIIVSMLILLSSCEGNSKLEQEQLTLEKNKEIVKNFYQEFFGDFNLEAANKYIGDTYIQHNPALADGRKALIDAGLIWFENAPKKKIEFNLIIAENDLVFVQIINKKNKSRFSTMDVFRVTNGKISEHWDAFASFKKGSTSKNDNPLF